MRARVAVAALVQEAFPDLDPATCHALRDGARAAAELGAIPDSPALRAGDDALRAARAGSGRAAAEFRGRLDHLAARLDGEDFIPPVPRSPRCICAPCAAATGKGTGLTSGRRRLYSLLPKGAAVRRAADMRTGAS